MANTGLDTKNDLTHTSDFVINSLQCPQKMSPIEIDVTTESSLGRTKVDLLTTRVLDQRVGNLGRKRLF